MIIAINGKIGVGKDLTGKIIQYLTLPTKHGPYIGFETFDDITLERNSTFKIKKFAGKLKQIASILTGIPEHMFEDQEFKKTFLSEEWDIYVSDANKVLGKQDFDNILEKAKVFYSRHQMSVRTLLQRLGTEAMREGLHTNVWVNALFADYKPKGNMIRIYPDPASIEYVQEYANWIITDTRFPNELEAVKEKGGLTIRVTRNIWKPNAGDIILIKVFSDWTTVTYINTDDDGNHYGIGSDGYKYKSSQIKQTGLHPSETALDDAKFDYEIINDGSIEDLIEKVKQILITEKII